MSFRNSTSSRASSDTKVSSSADGPKQWSEQVESYSLRSPDQYLCSGTHWDHFAKYLRRPYTEATAQQESQPCFRNVDHTFAVLYDFVDTQQVTNFRDPAGLSGIAERNAKAETQSQLLFMRGHPSPEWLNSVGAAFGVEAEFFFHHIRLFSREPNDAAWSWPPLASTRSKGFRLCLPTLAHLNQPGRRARKENHVRKLRDDVDEKFASYLRNVRHDHEITSGDSVLRKVSVHDAAHLSFEQEVSVYTKYTEKGWFCADFVDEWFLDALGRNREAIIVEPTVFGRGSPARANTQQTGTKSEGMKQNSKHLCHDFHVGLDPILARTDYLYVLNKVLRFAAASELSFLNMLREVVRHDTHQGILKKRDDASLANLHYNREILKAHVERLQDNVQSLERSASRSKAQAVSAEHLKCLGAIHDKLLYDFRDLLRSAESLVKECETGARSVTDLASHAESQKAIVQARGVESLTRLGTIFLPLSLITGFFGMNSDAFGQGSVPLWVFFACAGPTLLLSLVFLFPRLRVLWKGRMAQSAGDIEMGDWDAVVA